MAFRELTMIDVKEVLRRWSAGQGDRKIGREAGADRKTVARYTAAATKLGLERGDEVTDEEVHQVAQCVQARALVAPSEGWNEVAQHRARIERWLAGDGETRPLRLSKVHTLLARDHGLRASYDTLWRYAQQQLWWREKPSTVRVDDPPPGQEAQVDFGKMGWLLDAETGTSPDALGAHRDAVVQPLPVRLADVPANDRGGMRGARPRLDVLRGDHRRVIPDNTKAMVLDPDALNPTLVAAFLDYVQARGLFVDPARVRSPKDKPRVENQVAYVRESWFDGETFTGLDDARRERGALVSRDRRHARARHDATRSSRGLRVDGEGDDAAPPDGALRRAGLDRQGEGPSRSPHPGRCRPSTPSRIRTFASTFASAPIAPS